MLRGRRAAAERRPRRRHARGAVRPELPPDPLVPVGYERDDTKASLTMLAGNVAVNLASPAPSER